jgi:ribosomal protein S18 acetylase RimI-like enzyme
MRPLSPSSSADPGDPVADTLAAASGAPATRPARAWVPIRSLGPRHRDRMATHLCALDERSRYLRFGYAATEAQIHRYVDMIDFEQDEVFGIFNRRLELIALAHLAHRDADPSRGRAATSEFGVSVLPKARRLGLGRRLFENAMLHARNRGVHSIFIHALSENTAMLKLAKGAGAIVEREGPESEAWLKLPPDSFASHLDELLGEHVAELDYRLKRQAHQPEAVATETHLREADSPDVGGSAPDPAVEADS